MVNKSQSQSNSQSQSKGISKVDSEFDEDLTSKIAADDNKSPSKPKVINVDNEFDGDIDSAIAAANEGDIVELGSKVYYTDGINIDKDITIDGREGTVIDGEGTSNPVFTLDSDADGATIKDLEITNANIGVLGDDATDITLRKLEIYNIGNDEIIRTGEDNTAVTLSHADGFKIVDSEIYDVSKKGVGVRDTDGGEISGLSMRDINLEAEHAQSFDAGGIKLFNTNEVVVSNNDLSNINAFFIWNDITSGTIIEDNYITGVGEDFLAPDFNQNVTVTGIYNEKSYESVVRNNYVEAIETPERAFLAFDATEFSTETMVLEDNYFSSIALDTTDYWANEELEKEVAINPDPKAANFDLFADDFFAREQSMNG